VFVYCAADATQRRHNMSRWQVKDGLLLCLAICYLCWSVI